MNAVLIASLVAIATLGMMELGIRIGRQRKRLGLEAGTGTAIEGSVFAIFGLLVAFTFSGAASRFDARRAQITNEANAIGTVWLRLDLLPAAHQPALRDAVRRYLDERIATFGSLPDVAAALKHKQASEVLQGVLWKGAIEACKSETSPAVTNLILPPLNDCFDIATLRLRSVYNHPPMVVFALLVAMALVCAFISGNSLGSEYSNRILEFGFALMISFVVYIILDLEYPRHGFIRIDEADQVMIDLRTSMGPLSAP